MKRFIHATWIVVFGLAINSLATDRALGQYIPDSIRFFPYTDYGDMISTLSPSPGIYSLANPFVVSETDITGAFPPSNVEGGVFERNEHVARFLNSSETGGTNINRFGHLFQRREAWDIAFDLKIETSHSSPRKEAGLYFVAADLLPTTTADNCGASCGKSIVYVGTNGPGHYDSDPGPIGIIQDPQVIPGHNFGGGGILGDYNGNGTVDAADYTIWRDTFGSTTDFRANGNNEGESEDKIDQADYDVWKMNFGLSAEEGLHYQAGDTVRWRLIYTPPELIDTNLPDIEDDPNVMTPGTIEYQVSLNGGAVVSSGPIAFTNSWKGLPNGTKIMLRIQNLSTAAAAPDDAITTFSNFDLNGDLPGTGLGAGSGAFAGVVPEPGALVLIASALALCGGARRRGRC